MLAAERAESLRKPLSLKIFATDSQEDPADRAGWHLSGGSHRGDRAGASAALLRSARRILSDEKNLRELIVFAPQNLLRDPPFSRLDLITCRNLLIYLGPEAQRRVVALFHFALRQDGHLFLGTRRRSGRLRTYLIQLRRNGESSAGSDRRGTTS